MTRYYGSFRVHGLDIQVCPKVWYRNLPLVNRLPSLSNDDIPIRVRVINPVPREPRRIIFTLSLDSYRLSFDQNADGRWHSGVFERQSLPPGSYNLVFQSAEHPQPEIVANLRIVEDYKVVIGIIIFIIGAFTTFVLPLLFGLGKQLLRAIGGG